MRGVKNGNVAYNQSERRAATTDQLERPTSTTHLSSGRRTGATDQSEHSAPSDDQSERLALTADPANQSERPAFPGDQSESSIDSAGQSQTGTKAVNVNGSLSAARKPPAASKGGAIGKRRFTCKRKNCPYCTAQDCGLCPNCLNPSLKRKCFHRKAALLAK